MIESKHRAARRQERRGPLGESGVAAVELALILPLILLMLFPIIDLGRIIQAKLMIASLAREGGSLGSRDIQSTAELIAMLQSGARSLDLVASGKIYIWKIRAGITKDSPNPTIDLQASKDGGSLSVPSSINQNEPTLGLSGTLYNRLVFDSVPDKNTADISEVTVVEVFYRYHPITPIEFLPGMADSGMILSSKAAF